MSTRSAAERNEENFIVKLLFEYAESDFEITRLYIRAEGSYQRRRHGAVELSYMKGKVESLTNVDILTCSTTLYRYK